MERVIVLLMYIKYEEKWLVMKLYIYLYDGRGMYNTCNNVCMYNNVI